MALRCLGAASQGEELGGTQWLMAGAFRDSYHLSVLEIEGLAPPVWQVYTMPLERRRPSLDTHTRLHAPMQLQRARLGG